MSVTKHFFWMALLACCFILLFVGGPDYYAQRSIKEYQTLGHILFFAILPFYLFKIIKLPDSFASHLIAVLLLMLVVGAAVELIRNRLTRTPEFGDLLRNGIELYEDRCNRSYSFNYGWTTLRIPLTDIEYAPSNRKMDMQQIYGLGIFATRLEIPKTIYIDDVRLTM